MISGNGLMAPDRGWANSGHIPRVQRNALVRELGQEARAVTARWCVWGLVTCDAGRSSRRFLMTKNDNSGRRPRRPAAKPPVFLVGSRPSFLETLGSHQSSVQRGAEEKEAERPELETVPPGKTPHRLADALKEHRLADAWKEKLVPAVQRAKVMLGIGRNAERNEDPLSKSTIRLERFAKWLMAATLVSIFCTAWIAWSIHELHDFAFRQAKSVNDSIEISRYAILAANRRAEATEKTYDLAAETSRSQLRAYVSVLGISTQNAFEKNMASSLNYKNVGQTPALGLRTLTDAAIISSSGSDVKPPRTYSTSYGGDNEPTIALGGDIAASDPVNRTFKEAELEEFRAGSKLYVVWGVIYYSDVFGKNHYTRFCRYFRNDELRRWTPCQTGNDGN